MTTSNKKPTLGKAAKSVATAPFKFVGGAIEKVVAPALMSPYQIATDTVVDNKLKDPFEFNYGVNFKGLNVPVNHKIDASKTSIDRGFSFKRGGFTNDYNVVLDHEIRLGKATPIPELSEKVAARKIEIAEEKRQKAIKRAEAAQWWADHQAKGNAVREKHGLPPLPGPRFLPTTNSPPVDEKEPDPFTAWTPADLEYFSKASRSQPHKTPERTGRERFKAPKSLDNL